MVQHQPDHQLGRLPACAVRKRAPRRRVLQTAALRPGEQSESLRSVPALAMRPVSTSHGSLPDPGHRRPILRATPRIYPAHPTRAMRERTTWRDPPWRAPRRASRRRPRGRTSTAELPARCPGQPRPGRIARERCPPSLRHRRPAQGDRTKDATDKVPFGCRSYGRFRARLYNTERPHMALGGRKPAPEVIVPPSWPPGSASRPAWLRSRQCTNIETGPVDVGR